MSAPTDEAPTQHPVRAALWADFAPDRASPHLRRADGPLDLRGPFQRPGAPPLHLLRNATAGLFAGDRIDVRLRSLPGARVCLGSPAADKVYPGHGGDTRTHLRLEATTGSALCYAPQPIILQANARLAQTIELTCHRGGLLFFSEILVLGRLAMGERLAFSQFDSRLRVGEAHGPVWYAERSTIVPERDGPFLEAALGDAGALITVVLGPLSEPTAVRRRLARTLAALPSASAGVDELPGGGMLLVRGLAAGNHQAAQIVRIAAEAAADAWACNGATLLRVR